MQKTPSYLKGLAETRARTAGDVRRLERLLTEVSTQLDRARNELNACDTLIKKFDDRLNPELIQPISAWKGRYGARGALKQAILEYVESAGYVGASTPEISLYLQMKYKIEHLDWRAAKRWKTNSVSVRLREFEAAGFVERIEDDPGQPVRGGQVTRWRSACSKPMTLDQLAAESEAQGVAVTIGDGALEELQAAALSTR